MLTPLGLPLEQVQHDDRDTHDPERRHERVANPTRSPSDEYNLIFPVDRRASKEAEHARVL